MGRTPKNQTPLRHFFSILKTTLMLIVMVAVIVGLTILSFLLPNKNTYTEGFRKAAITTLFRSDPPSSTSHTVATYAICPLAGKYIHVLTSTDGYTAILQQDTHTALFPDTIKGSPCAALWVKQN